MAFDPLSLASTGLSLAAPLLKGITGLFQMDKKVKRVDTTPTAFKDRLQSLLLGQNALMSGYAQNANRLGQVQAASAANALRGAASSSDALAALASGDARRQAGEQQLGVQQGQYRDRATQQLNQGLQQQAEYQRADQARADQAQAALDGNGLSNLFGGLNDAAAAGVYALQQGKRPAPGSADALVGASGVPTTNAGYQIPYDQGDYDPYQTGYRRRRLTSPIAF